MSVHNNEIAEMLNRLADLLEIENANPFRVRAYRNAARTIGSLPQSVAGWVDENKDLTEIPGVGKDLSEKIKTIVNTGKLPLLEEVERRAPRMLSELMKIEGLGPKRVKALYENLQLKSFEDLKRAAESHRIREIKGFSEKSEQMIKAAMHQFIGEEKRYKLADVKEIADHLIAYLQSAPGISEVEIAGSYRRRKETVADLDILATAKNGSAVIQYFVKYDEVKNIISKGETRSTVKLRSGLQVDLRVVEKLSYGAALLYFTGSKAHNISIRKIAIKKKLKINEYGLYKGSKRIAGKTEAEMYKHIGLSYVEPEFREDRGEIEAAQAGKLPRLITLKDIRGDLHVHTKATDGKNSLEDMIKAAIGKNYEYIAITDHSQHLTVARGQNEKRLLQQIKLIDALNKKFPDITLLKSVEVDILENGSLDIADHVLKELDLTVCSIHYKFRLPAKKQTERILRAMDNPYFNILAHPTGRLINEREPYEIDIDRIFQAAKERNICLELNAHPNRLDLNDSYCKMAKDMKIKIAISTDAHNVNDFDFMQFGIDQARRGWLEKKDVINTYALKDLKKLLKRT